MTRTLCTIGFTKKDLRAFVQLLGDAGVTKLIDVRLRNTSQLSGFAKKEDLAFILELCDIAYEHVPDLAPTDKLLDGYRQDKDWKRYASAFRRLLRKRAPAALMERVVDGHVNVCLLCTEDKPDQCHRRLVAEYIQRQKPEIEVKHL